MPKRDADAMLPFMILVPEVGEPAELTEYAAQAAVEELVENWVGSFPHVTDLSGRQTIINHDITAVIAILEKFRAAALAKVEEMSRG